MGLLVERAAAYLPALFASCLIGFVSMRSILERAGEPAAPLDDSFIHLQYARRLVEGGFFSYVEGGSYTSGATSLLWPILLAPFYALGLRGVSLIYATWLLGTLAHAGVAVETYRISERLAGRAAAAGAGAMCVLFGAFAWFAWSGMETMALAWILMRAARVAAAWCEPPRRQATRSARAEAHLIALGILAPLIRPEGLIASLIAAIALALCPRGEGRARRARALAPLAGPLIVPALHLAFAGHASSSTTMVKWLVANPYYDSARLRDAIVANLQLLVTNILDGGDWTAVFVPEHAIVPIALGAVAMIGLATQRRLPMHALFVSAVALGTLIPCTYLSFLWNRVRYVWPFAGAWFVLAACFARGIGDLVRLVRPRATFVTPIVVGLFAGMLATKLSWTIHDLAQSASAISRQQVLLGRWANEHLPAEARIGVSDTGAIAYLSNRKTFDVVGLTTEGEARYWVAGAGSRFEHYEKMPSEALPTHFIVYPHWMACPPVLGEELTRATVTDQSILGGTTMVAYKARWDMLGSGALPSSPPPAASLVDELDVADLESEAAHGYDLEHATDSDNRALLLRSETRVIAEGGRFGRTLDRFVAKIPSGRGARLVMRVGADEPIALVVSVGGREIGEVSIDVGDVGDVGDAGSFSEPAIELPEASSPSEIVVRAKGGESATFRSFHYWIYAGS